MTTKAELRTTLRLLGRGVNQIASSLEAKGIRGYTEAPNACPLARFLQEQGYEDVNVVGSKIAADDIEISPTKAQARFIRRFDVGYWPALVAEDDLLRPELDD